MSLLHLTFWSIVCGCKSFSQSLCLATMLHPIYHVSHYQPFSLCFAQLLRMLSALSHSAENVSYKQFSLLSRSDCRKPVKLVSMSKVLAIFLFHLLPLISSLSFSLSVAVGCWGKRGGLSAGRNGELHRNTTAVSRRRR